MLRKPHCLLGIVVTLAMGLFTAPTPGANLPTPGAILVHRYNFDDGTPKDSVGTANAVLQHGATISGGQLVSPGGSGGLNQPSASLTTSNPISGLSTSFTVEDWFTPADLTPQETLFAFCTDEYNYFEVHPAFSYDGNRLLVGLQSGQPDFTGIFGPNLVINTEYALLITQDAVAGTTTAYLNGVSLGSVTTPANFHLSSLNTSEGIAGNTVFPANPGFHGLTNDFTLYSGAVTAAQAASLYSLGDDASSSQIETAAGGAPLPEPASASLLALFGILSGRGIRFRSRCRISPTRPQSRS